MLRVRLLDDLFEYGIPIASRMIYEPTTPIDQAEQRPDLNMLLCRLARELYAFPSASVREVARYRPWTPVPGAPAMLPGIISQRGMILPVVELRSLLGIDQAELTRAARLVIVIHDDIGMAVLVEAVLDLVAIADDAVEPVPSAIEPARARFLRGIIYYEGQPVGLLDLDELIAGLRQK
jgi:purine-binding chemotaxis protein CheW